ncbi:carbon-nitrogen hydrolase family protein [Kiloniella sp.]|uniref:carbon-nitrogen hydrolase family protein n=1 Tax=Kiloniella sp. TaxID=1938587 RepID=UPI003B010741
MNTCNKITIAVLQHNARLKGPDERFAWLDKQARIAASKDIELLVCPELFMTGYHVGDDLHQYAELADGDFAQRVKSLAKELGVAILYGYPERFGKAVYNSAICFDGDGLVLANHRKVVLPPGLEPKYFENGSSLTMFTFKSIKMALMICYECEFPETVRNVTALGAEVVLVCTACSWDQVPNFVAPARAYENGVFLIYANHAGLEDGVEFPGLSCILDPYGGDLARAGADEEVISACIDTRLVRKAQERLPYLRDHKKIPSSCA